MADDPAAALTAASRLTALLDDPKVGGDLLLVGVALVAAVDLQHPNLGSTGKTFATIPGLAKAIVTPRMRGYRLSDHVVRGAIRDDRRRYEPHHPGYSEACQAPMIRRAGYCGSTSGGGYHHLRDWTTGELRPLVYCSRHRDWAFQVHRDNEALAPDPDAPRGGAPEPYANVGGDLAAHFPEINWPKLWAKLDPRWVAPPERTTPPKPRLELLLGDDQPADEPTLLSGLRLIPSGREVTT